MLETSLFFSEPALLAGCVHLSLATLPSLALYGVRYPLPTAGGRREVCCVTRVSNPLNRLSVGAFALNSHTDSTFSNLSKVKVHVLIVSFFFFIKAVMTVSFERIWKLYFDFSFFSDPSNALAKFRPRSCHVSSVTIYDDPFAKIQGAFSVSWFCPCCPNQQRKKKIKINPREMGRGPMLLEEYQRLK